MVALMATLLPERMTLDETVAYNVKRLREDRGWSAETVANSLEGGGYRATKNLVYDMEGPRRGRRQRQFQWTDLVALCGVFNSNLYELVLPPEGVEIGDLRGLIIPDSDSPIDSEGYVERRIGRDGFSLRLFGIPGRKIGKVDLASAEQSVLRSLEERLEKLEKAAHQERGEAT